MAEAAVDLCSWIGLVYGMLAISCVIVHVRAYQLFGTGFSFWLLLLSLSVTVSIVSVALASCDLSLDACGDICIVVAGVSAYAAAQWLGQVFSQGEKDDS